MILLIDAGNTAIKFAVSNDSNQVALIQQSQLYWPEISLVLYSCVKHSDELQVIIERAQEFGIEIRRAKVSQQLDGLICGYEQYQNLGVDRWLTVLGAQNDYPNENLVIVDSGTATTIDFVSQNKKHLGGWIIPGLDLMVESISQRAPDVFTDAEIGFDNNIGANTPNALHNGCFVSTLGAVVIAQQHFDHFCRVIFTGGYGFHLHKSMENSQYDAGLIFKGLLVWYEKQAKNN